MNIYYTNLPLETKKITGYNHMKSEYAREVATYIRNGGKITKCEYEARATTTKIPAYSSTPEEAKASKKPQGKGLFDKIEAVKNREFLDIEAHFDNPEKY